MSDDRLDVTLREKPSPGTGFVAGVVGVIPRLWRYLKIHFPLLTNRAGSFADAKVEQERAEAERLHAEAQRLFASAEREKAEASVAHAKADLISATAEAVRAQTEIALATLPADNARLIGEREAAKMSGRDPEIAAKEAVRRALEAAEALGISVSLELVSREHHTALPESSADPARGLQPGEMPQFEE